MRHMKFTYLLYLLCIQLGCSVTLS